LTCTQQEKSASRNTHALRKSLEEEVHREGIGREELARAISKWRGSVHND
jgi:hypothetical protein